jgi:hypothetical protein
VLKQKNKHHAGSRRAEVEYGPVNSLDDGLILGQNPYSFGYLPIVPSKVQTPPSFVIG